jgi:hypothetical protein
MQALRVAKIHPVLLELLQPIPPQHAAQPQLAATSSEGPGSSSSSDGTEQCEEPEVEEFNDAVQRNSHWLTQLWPRLPPVNHPGGRFYKWQSKS